MGAGKKRHLTGRGRIRGKNLRRLWALGLLCAAALALPGGAAGAVAPLWSTYLGGSGLDEIHAVAVDASGAVYVTGRTDSPNFLGIERTPKGADVFIVKLDPACTRVEYAQFLGGSGEDHAHAIAVDASGAAYVAGWTTSRDLPTLSAFQPAYGPESAKGRAFVAKINPEGTAPVYVTYLGGSVGEAALALAVDEAGRAHVAGFTESPDFPVVNAPQHTYGGSASHAGDAFVATLAPDGASLLFSTFLGGADGDYAQGIAVDPAGGLMVAGVTWSTDFPVTASAFQRRFTGTSKAFVTRVDATGAIAASTFLGGSGADQASAVACDLAGAAYVTGRTTSADFPVLSAPQGDFGGGSHDAFATKLAPGLASLAYSTYLGGEDSDYGYGIRADIHGRAVVTGYTISAAFPAAGGGAPAPESTFVTWLDAVGSQRLISTCIGGAGYDLGRAVALDPSGNAVIAGFTSSPDFPTTPEAPQPFFRMGPYDGYVLKLAAPIEAATRQIRPLSESIYRLLLDHPDS